MGRADGVAEWLDLRMPAVVVFVGTAASGKTTLRHRIIDAGLDPELVVNLDELRAEARHTSRHLERPLMHFSAAAARRAVQRQHELVDRGDGYVADATHLRRAERRSHLRNAHDAGLRATSLLLPALPVHVLASRNAERAGDDRVPIEVLRRHAHRRSLISPDDLYDEGFDDVHEIREPRHTQVAIRTTRANH